MKRHENSSKQCRYQAFTLVELLVVIAIIGILVGLLLPAVQAAREAARRNSCMNNMTQMGLAIHHHEFSLERFPAGSINPDGPIRSEETGLHVSWVVQVLPYFEQQNLYKAFDQELGAYDDANKPARESNVPTIRCPTNPISYSRDETKVAIANYAGCHHNAEAPIDTDNNGVLFLNSTTRFRDITDGSSQTILLGEIVGDFDQLGWVSGTRATLRNTSGFEDTQDWSVNLMNARPGPLEVGKFGSFHTGGAVFTLADGATLFITDRIDPELLQQLGHRSDGELLKQEDDFGPF